MRLTIAPAFAKLADLPEPPPDFGEPPPPELQGITTPEKGKNPWLRGAKAVGSGLLGFGLGTAAGSGAALGVQKLLGKNHPALSSSKLLKVAPVFGGLMGVAYNQYKSREAEELRNALKDQQEQRSRGIPAK